MNPNLFRYIWQHSRREQIGILAIVLLSMPFNFLSFDLPKRIVNDAIMGRPFEGGQATVNTMALGFSVPEFLGGGQVVLSDGFQVDQHGLLWVLSLAFLALVIVNGAFKFHINLRKGVLGERMLRRLRYELFALFLRFRPEDIRGVKPAEAATIIKDEVEPIGGFIGDAFIQPAFLGMQALTAMAFIMVQSFWLGLVALAVVLVQAFVIPALRREQIRLARERQIESRKLAGRIGEIVETAPTLHALGSADYTRAEIGGQLGTLYQIRVRLFTRKFAVKYLNNLLAQVTPFFFYAIGGWLALEGRMDIGQLVAVIAAYRDLPPPIKELIDWDQARADVIVKYQQILTQFPTRLHTDDTVPDAAVTAALRGTAPIRLESVQLKDAGGTVLLEPTTLEIARPSHVALVGAGSGRDSLLRALARQTSDMRGRLLFDRLSLPGLPDAAASRLVGYVGADPQLVSGSVRDNVVVGLRVRPPAPARETDRQEQRRIAEALRSGNPPLLPSDAWFDPDLAGDPAPNALDQRIVELLSWFGLDDAVWRRGMLSRLDPALGADVTGRIVEARREVAEALREPGLARLVEQFEPGRFNRNATLAENLLFGIPVGERLQPAGFGADPYVRSILQAEAMLYPLVAIGLRMAEGAIEMFGRLPPGSPLFERLSYIQPDELPEFGRIAEQARQEGLPRLAPAAQARLMELGLSYNEPRYRMGVLDDTFEQRVVRTRQSLITYLPESYKAEIDLFDPARPMTSGSIRDNVLFGRISAEVVDAEAQVNDLAWRALRRLDLQGVILSLGLSTQVGPAGRQLQPRQRAAIALARALLPRPDTIILDGAMGSFSPAEGKAVMDRIRSEWTGRTLLATADGSDDVQGFDRVLIFEGARLISDTTPDATPSQPAATAPSSRATALAI